MHFLSLPHLSVCFTRQPQCNVFFPSFHMYRMHYACRRKKHRLLCRCRNQDRYLTICQFVLPGNMFSHYKDHTEDRRRGRESSRQHYRQTSLSLSLALALALSLRLRKQRTQVERQPSILCKAPGIWKAVSVHTRS